MPCWNTLSMSPWPTRYRSPRKDSTPPAAMPRVSGSRRITTLSSMLSSGISAVRMAMLVAVVVSAAR
ncbi:hypothetical protein D3C85_1424790 [compost metagenome]